MTTGDSHKHTGGGDGAARTGRGQVIYSSAAGEGRRRTRPGAHGAAGRDRPASEDVTIDTVRKLEEQLWMIRGRFETG